MSGSRLVALNVAFWVVTAGRPDRWRISDGKMSAAQWLNDRNSRIGVRAPSQRIDDQLTVGGMSCALGGEREGLAFGKRLASMRCERLCRSHDNAHR
jgi:hypothetical protein